MKKDGVSIARNRVRAGQLVKIPLQGMPAVGARKIRAALW